MSESGGTFREGSRGGRQMATRAQRGSDTANSTQGAAMAHPEQAPGTMRRRGVIAGAALALGMAVVGEQRVTATTGGAMLIGQVNFPTASTDVTRLSNPTSALSPNLISVQNYSGSFTVPPAGARVAIQGYTSATGATGMGDTVAQLIGVFGNVGGSSSTISAGVYGISSDNGSGVIGTYGTGAPAPAYQGGVAGTAPNNGQGISGTCNGASGYGVAGFSNIGFGMHGTSASGTGVYGYSSSFYGVEGISDTGIGLYGTSTTGYGVVASVGSGGVAAVYASSSTPNTPAFYAVNYAAPNPPNSNAGFFIGQVYINGPLVIAGGAKSAAVPHPDGTHRLLYCMESPESWFEDFGVGTISGGKAEVKLDADFAAVVDTKELHVFLTPHDEHALHVPTRSNAGFSVAAAPSTVAAARGVKVSDISGTFTYRVVAKRKDVAAPRLAKFDLPKVPTPPPAPPPVPEKKPMGSGVLPAPVPMPGSRAKA